MSNIKLELPDEVLESLFLNKISTSPMHTLAFSQIFDERWINDSNIKILCKIIFVYFKNSNKLPTFTLIEQFVKKLSEKSPIDVDEVKASFEKASKIEFNNDLVVNGSLLEFIRRKGLYFAILDNLDKIEAKKDVSSILTTFSQILNISIDQDLGTKWIADIDEHFETIKSTTAKLSTGVPEFDTEFNGGLLAEGKCIWIPVGMPGIGKTAFISNLAFNFFTMNKKVSIITMEINQELYKQRIDALASGIEINMIPKQDGVAIKRIKDIAAKSTNGEIVVKEFPPKSINTSVIDNYLDRLVLSGFKPDVLIIDYLNLVLPAGISSDSGMYERVGTTAQELRAITYKFLIPMICPTQFNTEGFDNVEPTMKNISESRAVAHVADVITSIWQGDGDRESNVINFKNLKNRLGGKINRKLSLKINYDTLRMTSMIGQQKQVSNKTVTDVIGSLDQL
jgi:archaellum biogenesis ATPase FlaH